MDGRNRTLSRLGAGLALAIAAMSSLAAQVAPTPPVTSAAPTPADALDRATQPVAPPATPAAQSQARTVEEQKTMPPRDPAFARLDTDNDGRISAVEADADSKFGLTFDDMDTDEDGFVSNAEFAAFGKAAPPPAPPTAQGAEHAAEHSAVATRETFGGLDKDKDGRVSSTEASTDASFDAGFAAMDANGDGFVSDTEYRAQAKSTGRMEDKQP